MAAASSRRMSIASADRAAHRFFENPDLSLAWDTLGTAFSFTSCRSVRLRSASTECVLWQLQEIITRKVSCRDLIELLSNARK
jgi:hypothetical protein